MNRNFHAAALIAAMSAFTILLRFLPFAVFRKKVPNYVIYLGKVLPPAIIGMLVVYCLRNTAVRIPPFGMPELIAITAIIIQTGCRKRCIRFIRQDSALDEALLNDKMWKELIE